MPSIAAVAVKTEKVSVLDVPESFKAAATVIEKKCRNLEKRKGKLDGYREELVKGRSLSEEQQQAVLRYNEVIANLDLTREFITAFDKIASDTTKEEKKRKQKENSERQQFELARLKEVFTIQEVFNCLCSSSAREDFLNGYRGSPQLSEADLQKLNTFFSLVTIDRQNLPGNFNDAITNTATHFQQLLEGRNKEVAGSTYRELKGLIQSIVQNGYFDWKPPTEVEQKEPEIPQPEIIEETVYHNQPEEPTFVDSGLDYVEPVAPLPIQPQVAPPAPTYFPVDVDTDFNFIQESLIDSKPVLPTSVPVPVSLASMDSAVVMVHSQVPHMAYPHFAAAAASMYAAHAGSIVPQADVESAAPTTSPIAQVEDAAPAATSAWAEEPQDDAPNFQQDQSRTESNTWTNSNYRPNDQDGRRGGYRGRGNGGQRGQRGTGYYNPRGGYDRQNNGERNYQNDRYQGNGDRNGTGTYQSGERAPYQGNGRYQGNNAGGERTGYQGNNQGSFRGGDRGGYRGGYRGTNPRGPSTRGSSSRGGYEQRPYQQKEQPQQQQQ